MVTVVTEWCSEHLLMCLLLGASLTDLIVSILRTALPAGGPFPTVQRETLGLSDHLPV